MTPKEARLILNEHLTNKAINSMVMGCGPSVELPIKEEVVRRHRTTKGPNTVISALTFTYLIKVAYGL